MERFLEMSILGDLPGLRQGDLGNDRAGQLVDERTRQNDSLNLTAILGQLGQCHGRQTDGHTGLRNQGEAQIFLHVGMGMHHPGTEHGAQPLADYAEQHIAHADKPHGGQNAQVQLRTGNDEEQQEQRRREAVGSAR